MGKMKYLAHIKFEWGTKETKEFSSKEERHKYLTENEEIISTATIQNSLGIKPSKPKPDDKIYSLFYNMSDYEMDVYL